MKKSELGLKVMSSCTTSNNSAVKKLISKYSLLAIEVHQLNREFLCLKNKLRRKQKTLRGVKKNIIRQSAIVPYLSLVKSFAPNVKPAKQVTTGTRIVLTCLQGGKQ